MKVLFVTSRFPEPHARGDQSRSFSFLTFLGGRHDVEVVSSGRPSSPNAGLQLARSCRYRVEHVGLGHRALSALVAVLRGQPAQVGWMMPGQTWRKVREASRDVDVVLVSTARAIRGPVTVPLVVDFVDALSWNMRLRAKGPESFPVRVFALFEAWRMGKWEQRVSVWATRSVASSGEVSASIRADAPPTIVPIPWEGPVKNPELPADRDIDVIFTGDMRYPPNREGAAMLANAIAPLVRERRPSTSFWVVGRSADKLRLSGIDVASDVPSISEFLSRARVAVAPVRGRGSPYKVLEAAANGAAVVSYPWAVECYGLDAETGEDAPTFAAAIIRLLDDESHRLNRAREGLAAARSHTVAELGSRLEGVLSDAAARSEPGT